MSHLHHHHEHSSNDQSNVGGCNPYVQISPTPASGRRPADKLCDVLNRCGKNLEDTSRKAGAMADNVWHHLRLSPSIPEAAMAWLSQGTKVLAEGGRDKMFRKEFSFLPGEKLVDAYACYLSTSSGPVIGTLYVSNLRAAFCSDYALRHFTPSGQQEWLYYKVMLRLDQILSVNPSASRCNPSERYIHIITRDGYEFWFMGFISFDKALKNLTRALEHSSRSLDDST